MNFYHFWVIDVLQNQMSIKAACIKHRTNRTQAYLWLKQHPTIRAAYMSAQGKRMRWKEEKKKHPRSKSARHGPWRKKNPSSAGQKASSHGSSWKRNEKRKANLEWAEAIKREVLLERRDWLYMLLMNSPPVRMKKLLQLELQEVEKALKRL